MRAQLYCLLLLRAREAERLRRGVARDRPPQETAAGAQVMVADRRTRGRRLVLTAASCVLFVVVTALALS